MQKKMVLIISFLIVSKICFATENTKIEELQKQIYDLRLRIYNLELDEERGKTIDLNLTEKTYQKIDTNMGILLVVCENVSPYLDGYKITLSIGNPSYLKYCGFTLKVKYGKKYISNAGEDLSFLPDQPGQVKIEKIYTDNLLPGAWSKVELILSPAKTEELAYVSLSIDVNVVSLLGK